MTSERDLIRSLAIIVGSFVIGGIIFLFLRYDIENESLKVQKIKAQANRETELTVLFSKLKTQADEARPYEERFAKLLPEQDRLIDFRNYLDVLASQRGVATTFTFDGSGTPGSEGAPGYIGFSLELSGNLVNIEGLLEDIEGKPRAYLLSVDSLALSKSQDGYHGVFRGRLFYK